MIETDGKVTEGNSAPGPYRTMQQIVGDFLTSAIVSGRLGPGDRIDQDDVARQLGVSRMPVREALRMLQSKGLVELRPHRVAVVVSLQPEDIAEILEIRAILESRAAELAAPRLTQETLDRLAQGYDAMSAALAPEDQERWLGLNRQFHATLYGACKWPRLCAMIDTQQDVLLPYRRAATGLVARTATAHEEHRQILLAARDRDGKRLGQLITEHLRGTARDLIGYISNQRHEAPGDMAGSLSNLHDL